MAFSKRLKESMLVTRTGTIGSGERNWRIMLSMNDVM